MTEPTETIEQQVFQVAALDAEGKSSIWHVIDTDFNAARHQVAVAIEESTLKKPAVVLAIVPKGTLA